MNHLLLTHTVDRSTCTCVGGYPEAQKGRLCGYITVKEVSVFQTVCAYRTFYVDISGTKRK